MKKILAGILIGTLCIGSLSACGKNTSEEKSSTLSETTNSTNETEVQTEKVLETEAADLNDTVPFSMSDIEWDIEENIVNGTRKYAISYTNNTKYDMLGLDITYSRKSGVTDEQMLNVFSDVQSEYDYEDSEIENLQLNACNYAFIVSGEKADKEASYVAGDVHGKDFKEITEEQFNLFEPDTAEIHYISGDKIYTVYYDFKNDEMNCDSADVIDKFSWSDSNLANAAPKPEYDIVVVLGDGNNIFSYDICNIAKDDFDDYREQCIQKGFVKDSINDEEHYEAENSDGIMLGIIYEATSNRMTCVLGK